MKPGTTHERIAAHIEKPRNLRDAYEYVVSF
jgi:hypothetical protein